MVVLGDNLYIFLECDVVGNLFGGVFWCRVELCCVGIYFFGYYYVVVVCGVFLWVYGMGVVVVKVFVL